MGKVSLKKLEDFELQRIYDFFEDEHINYTFANDYRSRLACSLIAFIVEKDEEEVGFINFVYEELNNSYNIDLGILDKYRGLGYGSQATKLLKEIIQDCNYDLSIQAEEENYAANRILEKNGFSYVKRLGNINYYK